MVSSRNICVIGGKQRGGDGFTAVTSWCKSQLGISKECSILTYGTRRWSKAWETSVREHLFCWVDNKFHSQFYFQNCTSVGASSLESQGTYASPPISTPSFSASSGGLSSSGLTSCAIFFKSICAIFFKSTPFLIRFADRGLVVGGQQYTILLKKIHWTELAKKDLPLWAECPIYLPTPWSWNSQFLSDFFLNLWAFFQLSHWLAFLAITSISICHFPFLKIFSGTYQETIAGRVSFLSLWMFDFASL